MKYLKKIFEFDDKSFLDSDELRRVCKDIFSELIDDGHCDVDFYENKVTVCIYIKEFRNHDFIDYSEFYENQKKYFQILEDFNIGVNRLKEHYNDKLSIKMKIYGDDEVIIEIGTNEIIKGDYYIIDNNIVKFDYNKMRQILGIPKSVDISLSTTGDSDRLNFYFPTKEELEKYEVDLLNKFSFLKIEDVLLCDNVKFGYSTSTGDVIQRWKVSKDYSTNYRTGDGREVKQKVNLIEFGLTKKFDYDW